MNPKPVLIMFGGPSPEHEVSVVTGLQVVEKIDRTRYTPHVVFVTPEGTPRYCGVLKNRKEFLACKKKTLTFGKDAHGGYIAYGLWGTKVYPYVAYMAFHGGIGESGGYQGVCASFGIPHTGSSVEGSVIAMNKEVSKVLAQAAGVSVVSGVSVRGEDILRDSKKETARVLKALALPVIVKPAHLGSSIGIHIARTEHDLERILLEAAHMDTEIVVETLLTEFIEYNCSVRETTDGLQTSPVERPVSQDEILSFADKYQRGGGKKGGEAGMASLDREVPARISDTLRDRIQNTVKTVFRATRARGMARVDCMYHQKTDTLYLTEINPIPGSMAFYLWEATGISFKQQITDALEYAQVRAQETASHTHVYKSDIIEKFCA